MKKILGSVAAISLTLAGVAAFAHSGATGVVKERMDAMSAMGKAMKTLTPMMRGQSAYDAGVVRDAADIMIMHSGDQMTRLFPEGTGGMPSLALDNIWEDPEEFARIATALGVAAEGMKRASDNGLAASDEGQGASMMGGETANMMGSSDAGMMGGGATDVLTAEMLADMPINAAFMAVTQSCSACHGKFRAEEE